MTLLQFAHEHPVVTVFITALQLFAACVIVGIVAQTRVDLARAKEWNDRREKEKRTPFE